VDEDDDLVEYRQVFAFGSSATPEGLCEDFEAQAHRVSAAGAPRHYCEAPGTEPLQRCEALRIEGGAEFAFSACGRRDYEGFEAGKPQERREGAVEDRALADAQELFLPAAEALARARGRHDDRDP
jgi:hypothetical protein